MIADHIVHFARVLRDAGMAIGPDRVLAALAAVELVGLQRRDDVHAALGAVMLERHEQQTLFDAAFDASGATRSGCSSLRRCSRSPAATRLADHRKPTGSPRRCVQRAKAKRRPTTAPGTSGLSMRSFSASERERLHRADFESMTTAEYAWAKKLAEDLPLPMAPVRRRRHGDGEPRPPRRAARPARDD